MAIETVTRAIESELEPKLLYRILANPSLIPRWAPVFAEKVESTQGNRFRVIKGADSFDVELLANETALTVDYLRSMANGRRGGAYIRVMPKPLGGSAIAMTVPVGPGVTAEQVANVLEKELVDLIQLASSER